MVVKFKNIGGVNVDETQSMFVLRNLEKIKETRSKLPQGSVTIL